MWQPCASGWRLVVQLPPLDGDWSVRPELTVRDLRVSVDVTICPTKPGIMIVLNGYVDGTKIGLDLIPALDQTHVEIP